MLALIIAAIIGLEADFMQTKQVALMNEPQVSSGHMTYRAPDFMRKKKKKPETIVWEVDGDKSNVNPQIQKLLRMIMSSIAGNTQEDTRMLRESKRLFKAVNITMDEKQGTAKRVELIEKNGDTTIIEFSNVIKK